MGRRIDTDPGNGRPVIEDRTGRKRTPRNTNSWRISSTTAKWGVGILASLSVAIIAGIYAAGQVVEQKADKADVVPLSRFERHEARVTETEKALTEQVDGVKGDVRELQTDIKWIIHSQQQLGKKLRVELPEPPDEED